MKVVAPESQFVRLADRWGLIAAIAATMESGAPSFDDEVAYIGQLSSYPNGSSARSRARSANALESGLRKLDPGASIRTVQGGGRFENSLDVAAFRSVSFEDFVFGSANQRPASSEDIKSLLTSRAVRASGAISLLELYGSSAAVQNLRRSESRFPTLRPSDKEQLRTQYDADIDAALADYRAQLPAILQKIKTYVAAKPEVPETHRSSGIIETLYAIAYGLTWAADYTRYRYENARDLSTRFPGATPAGQARLYCHALVDYELWLDPKGGTHSAETQTSLPQQMQIAGLIARHPIENARFHGFYPFDPLRAVIATATRGAFCPHPLDQVKAAVTEQGFIGTKVYPPMGFFPIGNERVDLSPQNTSDEWPPDGLSGGFGPTVAELSKRPDLKNALEWGKLGKLLDAELLEFYRYCLLNDLPILSHTSGSQNSFREAAMRPAPSGWKLLLDRPSETHAGTIIDYSKLRVNLGHLGGLWCLGKLDVDELTGNVCVPLDPAKGLTARDFASGKVHLSDTWTAQTLALLASTANGTPSYPNIAADFADFSAVSDWFQTGERDLALENLSTILRQNDTGLKRVIYGTDWSLLAREIGFRGYFAGCRDFVRSLAKKLNYSQDQTAELMDDIMWRNAAQFLGLREPTNASRPNASDRLKSFYQTNGLDDSILNGFRT